jgi:hypothetical protein
VRIKIEISQAVHGDLDQPADLLAELFTLEKDFHPDRVKQSRGLRLSLDNPVLGRDGGRSGLFPFWQGRKGWRASPCWRIGVEILQPEAAALDAAL